MNVLVLLGGPSAERDVSLRSGQNVLQALQERGHQTMSLDPAEVPLETATLPDCDVVFIALHGTYGEDGQVQTLLEQRGLPYTGSGPEASYNAFHKLASKACFQRHHVRTPDYVRFSAGEEIDQIQTRISAFDYPLFVKPDAQGSSIGVSYVTSPAELPEAIALALNYDAQGLIEPAIRGTEWTVGLSEETVFPPLSVQSARTFYDYQAKYEDQQTRVVPVNDLPANIETELISQARQAYRSVNASGVARVDLILDAQNSQAYVLEINTIPGLTSSSCVPRAAKCLGWSFGELCEWMCQEAISRHSQLSTNRQIARKAA